jgi:hypothetical protein
MSARRASARARRRRRAHALVKSARRCTVLELAGTRAERRRGGVRARARARGRNATREDGVVFDVPVRSAYVALHTSEKLASATKARGWVGIIGKPARSVRARGARILFHGGSVGKEEGTRAYLWRVAPRSCSRAWHRRASRARRRGCGARSPPPVARRRERGEGKKTQHHASREAS